MVLPARRDAVRGLVRLGADRDVRGPRRGRHLVDVEDRLSAEPAPRERGGLLSAREESLLQVAALIAGGASSADVFAAVAREVGQVVGLPVVGVWRYEPGQMTATVIGAWGSAAHPFQAGVRWPLDGRNVLAEVLSTG